MDIPVDPTILDAGDHNGSTFYQHARFLDIVKSGGTPEVTLADGAKAVAIGLAAQEAARTGETVRLDLPMVARDTTMSLKSAMGPT